MRAVRVDCRSQENFTCCFPAPLQPNYMVPRSDPHQTDLPPPMTLRLHTFGSVYLTRDGEIMSGPAGERRLLAILTILATVGDRGISREKLLALLWSEGEPEKSRHALTQSLYHIRKALNVEKLFLSGADVRLSPGVLASDVADF